MTLRTADSVDWSLHPLELTMLLERFGRDRLPYPLRSRIDADTGSEVALHRDAAARRIDELLDADLELAANTMLTPTYRVEMLGRCEDGTILRSLTAVRGTSAVVLVQDPGPNADVGGTVHVGFTATSRAIRRSLAVLPHVRPGSHRPIAVQRKRSRHSVLDRVSTEQSAEQFDLIFARPRSGVGAFTIAPGPAIDNRPEYDAEGFFWIDLQGDGRYLVHSGDAVAARPAADDDFIDEIARLARVVVR